MSLEKDILQSEFRNEHQKALINFIYTYNCVNEKMKFIFDRQNITSQQFNILRILRGAEKPISTLQIRQRMLDKMSDTSRIVDRLVLKEYVKKNTCADDKRLVDVYITEKGKELLKIFDRYQDEMDGILGALSPGEAKTMNFLFDKIRSSDE